MAWILSLRVEIHFVFSRAWERFGQHDLKYILCPLRQGMGLVNTCRDTYCVLAGIEGVHSTLIEMYFLFSLAWDYFGQRIEYVSTTACEVCE
jgi:hypothetical protein